MMSSLFSSYIFLILHLCTVTLASDPSVIIIGAGPAGIAAATKLLENSFTNIKILEAEDRIGGRINSVKFGETDKFVDVGAEYCHGQKNSIVYELAKDVLEPVSPNFHVALYYSNGSRLDSAFTEELQAVILGYDSHSSDYNSTGSSIGALFLKKYNETIVKTYQNDNEKLKLLKEALRLAEQVSLMIDGAFTWADTSAVKHYERSEGHQLLVWKGRGYKTILDILMKQYPDPSEKLPIDDKLHLSRQVYKISWNAKSQVVVTTSDNASHVADHVIFTPSIGVLKDTKDTLFNPPLPSAKLNAIEAIGIGGVMKIIMRFSSAWWRDEVMFAFLWREEDLISAAKEFPHGPIRNDVSWLSAITVMAKVPGNPNILIAWLTGNFVPEVEKTPTHILKDGCAYLINKFLGNDFNVSSPDHVIKSGWRSNPHFRGTYSYERAGFERDNVRYQEDLAEPLRDVEGKPLVLFAGEATNPVHYSTVHGAIETGHREARRIIDLYKQN